MKRSKKLTFNKIIIEMPTPRFITVLVPLDCELCVQKEEVVNAYQKLGVCDNVYYFSPCSGYILDCSIETDEFGEKCKSVVIQNDGRNEGVVLPSIESTEDVKQRIIESGLNSAFKGVEFCLCATDDKYYINNDNALLNTYKKEILIAINLLKSFGHITTNDKGLSKILSLNFDNAKGNLITLEDLYKLWLACYKGISNIYKVITVSGMSVKEPRVVRVAVGTEYGEIMDFCGGEKYPLAEYNKLLNTANESYGKVLDLKEEYKASEEPEKSHIASELVDTRRQSYANIIEFLKVDKKYSKVLLDGLVYGDYLNGIASEDFNKVVTLKSKGMLLLNKKENTRREKDVCNKR